MKPIITLISTLIISFAGSAMAVTENDLRYEVGGDLEKGILMVCDADGNSTISGKEVLCKIHYKINNNNKKEGAAAEDEIDKKIAEAKKRLARTKEEKAKKIQELENAEQEIAKYKEGTAKYKEGTAKNEQAIKAVTKDIKKKIE